MALLLSFEAGVTVLSERGIQKALKSQYGMPDNIKVSVNSFPLTVSLVRNHLGQVKITWQAQAMMTTQDGKETDSDYFGQINLYDVELDMPALIRTSLAIRQISRVKAAIILDQENLDSALGLEPGSLSISDGHLQEAKSNPKLEYKVKVSGGDTISLEPLSGYSGDSDSPKNPQSAVQQASATINADELPLQASFQSASIEGDYLVIDIAIPIWEGYIQI
jgi:hypothetical protein